MEELDKRPLVERVDKRLVLERIIDTDGYKPTVNDNGEITAVKEEDNE